MEATQSIGTEGCSSGCAAVLRVIGQALEDLHIEDFSLESDANDYIVHGKPKRLNPTREKFRTFWGSFQRRYFGSKDAETDDSGTATLRYTPDDINRLEEQHRRRDLAAQKKPD